MRLNKDTPSTEARKSPFRACLCCIIKDQSQVRKPAEKNAAEPLLFFRFFNQGSLPGVGSGQQVIHHGCGPHATCSVPGKGQGLCHQKDLVFYGFATLSCPGCFGWGRRKGVSV